MTEFLEYAKNSVPKRIGCRKPPELLEIERTVCDTNASVPRFEGEEDDQYETRDLPEVPIPGTAAPDPLSVIEISNLSDCERVAKLPSYARNPLEGHEMLFECPGVALDTHTVVDRRFDLKFCS